MQRRSDVVRVGVSLWATLPLRGAPEQDFGRQVRLEECIRGAGAYLMGERFSIADILFMSCLDWARWYDVPLPDYLMAWRQRIGARPAYLEAIAENYPGRSVAEAR